MKQNLLLTILLLLFAANLFAQQKLRFTYDTAGNQITRARVCNTCLKARLPAIVDSLVIDSLTTEAIAEEIPLPTLEEDFRLSIYPNPVSDMLSVDWDPLPNDGAVAVQVYSMNGRQLVSYDLQPGDTHSEISLGQYPIGLYMLSLQLKSGKSKRIKAIKV